MLHAQRWTAILAVLSASGCGAAAVPAEGLASAEGGIRAASEVGAEGVPPAALHLKMARDQVELAKSLARNGDGDRAAMVMARAESDAELALAFAKESAARADAKAMLAQIQALQQQQP